MLTSFCLLSALQIIDSCVSKETNGNANVVMIRGISCRYHWIDISQIICKTLCDLSSIFTQVTTYQLVRCQGGGGPSTFGYDASSACSKPYSRSGRARFSNLPCDFRRQNWCTIAGNAYPWYIHRILFDQFYYSQSEPKKKIYVTNYFMY